MHLVVFLECQRCVYANRSHAISPENPRVTASYHSIHLKHLMPPSKRSTASTCTTDRYRSSMHSRRTTSMESDTEQRRNVYLRRRLAGTRCSPSFTKWLVAMKWQTHAGVGLVLASRHRPLAMSRETRTEMPRKGLTRSIPLYKHAY